MDDGNSPRDRKIVRHMRAIGEAGTDLNKFVAALESFRDDSSLTTSQREAVIKTLAQEAMAGYVVMVTGKPIDPIGILEQHGQLDRPS